MKLLVLVSLLVAVYAQEPCCFPRQWEGFMNIVEASVDTSLPNPEVMVTNDRMAIAADYISQVMATRTAEGVRTVFDFVGNRMSIIQPDETCVYYEYTEGQTECVPVFALLKRTSYYGIDEHKLEVQDWAFIDDEFDQEMSVSANTCTPIMADWTLNSGTRHVVGGNRFDQLELTISDPSIFVPPEGCAPGKAQAHTKSSGKSLPLGHLLTRHMKSKPHPTLKLKDILNKPKEVRKNLMKNL